MLTKISVTNIACFMTMVRESKVMQNSAMMLLLEFS